MHKLNVAAVVCCIVFLFCLPARAASGIVSPTGPFVGSMSESWESFPTFNGTYLPSPTTIMGGGATVANSQMAVYQVGSALLGTSGIAQTADGTHGLMLNYFTQSVTIAFSTPITKFGSYFAAGTSPAGYDGDPAIITANFFDTASTLFDTEIFTYSHSGTGDGGLDWHGWVFSVPISSIKLTGNFLVLDSLRATVPEPSALILLPLIFVSTALLKNRKPETPRRVYPA